MKKELQNYQNKTELHQEDAEQELLQKLEGEGSSRLIRSYGRIKSRKLSGHKNSLLENLLASYEISDEDFVIKKHSAENTLAKSKVSFEIGFGFGDFLFAKAQANPSQMFLGCEPHVNGVVNVLAKLEEAPLSNVKISRQDARELLNKFHDNFFDEIYILFPDPWPKIKHFKRRLINLEFLDNLLAQKIKSGGKLIIATDHDSYKTWILSSILKSHKFRWDAASRHDWQNFPSDWIVTKYQKKAAREGRVSVLFNLTKI